MRRISMMAIRRPSQISIFIIITMTTSVGCAKCTTQNRKKSKISIINCFFINKRIKIIIIIQKCNGATHSRFLRFVISDIRAEYKKCVKIYCVTTGARAFLTTT